MLHQCNSILVCSVNWLCQWKAYVLDNHPLVSKAIYLLRFIFFIVATFCNVYINFMYCCVFPFNPTVAGLVCFADSDNCWLSLNHLQLMCTANKWNVFSFSFTQLSINKPYFERDWPSVDRGSRILSCQHGHFLFGFIHSPRELKKKPQLKRQMSVSSLILTWCKDVTQEYEVSALENVWLKRSSMDYTKRKVIALTSQNKHSIKPIPWVLCYCIRWGIRCHIFFGHI